ncbi:MAG TPA: hypothetical protein VF628_01130 [Allosphingosinicella sp.]
MHTVKAALIASTLVALSGCSGDGELLATGVRATRSACPSVAIPAATGDVTVFNPPSSRDARAIDVVANITNLRSTCDETGANIVTNATFEVQGQRRDATGDREVVLQYFATVVQGGNNVVSKRIGRVALRFANGQLRASTRGTATGQVLRSAATLPDDVRRQITRERKPGDADAALDPLADPTVRAAVTRASFEFLVGFQLTPEQLAYNATR